MCATMVLARAYDGKPCQTITKQFVSLKLVAYNTGLKKKD